VASRIAWVNPSRDHRLGLLLSLILLLMLLLLRMMMMTLSRMLCIASSVVAEDRIGSLLKKKYSGLLDGDDDEPKE
jgi:hypothetical protein